MVKKVFALSLLFAISSTGALRANKCIENISDTVTQSAECACEECTCEECVCEECSGACLEKTKFMSKSFELSKFMTINIELKKTNDVSWAPLAERTYAMLSSLENEKTKETATENLKSYMKQMYEMARELNVSGSMDIVASDEAPTTSENAPDISLEDVINGDTISIACTIEKDEDNCEAMQDIIDHAKAMTEDEKDSTLECVEGLCDAVTNSNGTISIDVK